MRKQYFKIHVLFVIALNIYSYDNFSQSNRIDTVQINALIDSAYLLSSTNYSKSLFFLDEALDMSQRINYSTGMGDVYYVRSRVYYYKDNYPIAIKYLNKARKIYKEINSTKGMANYYFGLGQIETLYGNNINAIKAYQQAMQYEEKSNSIRGKSIILNALADVNSKMKNHKIALKYAKEALELKNKIGNKIEISNTLENLGHIFQEMDSLDKAEVYYSQSLNLRKELKDQRRIASSFFSLADIHLLKKEPVKANEELNKALVIFTGLDEKTGQVICLLSLSKAYNMLGLNKKSKNSIDKALGISKITKNNELLKDCYKQYADFYSINNNQTLAFNYFKKYINIKDSLINVNNIRLFNELELKYQTEKKDDEISLLKKKSELQKKNNIILILSIIIMFFISTLLFFFYRSNAQKLQINSQLLEKEKIIHKQDVEIKEHETNLLKHELESKNRELTSKVLVMLKTNQMLDDILQKLSIISKNSSTNQLRPKDISSIIREIENHSGNTLWQDFDTAFRGVHSEFYNKLLKINPHLTSSEIKMASLLKLNLNTKEIADITFKSESSIKSTRFRLRKKLGLDSDTGLVTFLIKL